MLARVNIAVVCILQQSGLASASVCAQTSIAHATVDTQHVCFANPCLDAGSPNSTPGMKPSMHMSANRNATCFFHSVLPREIVVNELPSPKSGGDLRSAEVRVIRIGGLRVGASHTTQHASHVMAKRSASEVISTGFGQGHRACAHHQGKITSPPCDNPGHAEHCQPSKNQVLGLILLLMLGNLRFLSACHNLCEFRVFSCECWSGAGCCKSDSSGVGS